jgi:hypothetical protein
MGKRLVIMLTALLFIALGGDFSFVKAGSSTKSSGGSSTSSSGHSSKSYGNTSRSAPAAPSQRSKYGNTGTKAGGGVAAGGGAAAAAGPSSGKSEPRGDKYGNTGRQAAGGAGGPSTQSRSTFDREVNKSVSKEQAAQSLKSYESERSKFKSQPKANTTDFATYRNAPVMNRTPYDSGTYAYRRDRFYGGTGYAPPPYIYHSTPAFGMWDAMFLWFMLDNITRPHYANMYYNHQNDPGFQQWRREADRLAGENSELKAKLAKLDGEVGKLKGQPVDPSYVPPGVDPDIMMDKKALDTLKTPEPKKGGGSFNLLFWIILLGILLAIIVAIVMAKRRKVSQPKYTLD